MSILKTENNVLGKCFFFLQMRKKNTIKKITRSNINIFSTLTWMAFCLTTLVCCRAFGFLPPRAVQVDLRA